jgi:selenocysteine-specific elongation factor
MGVIALLDCDTIEPGGWGLAQVFLEGPVTATWGQPFVVRGSSATFTLGGGQVLQPVAHKIRRRHLEVLERVERLWTGNAAERALMVAWFAGYGGVVAADLVRGAGSGPDSAQALFTDLKEQQKVVDVATGSARRLLLHADLLEELQQRVLAALDDLHREFPLMSTHDRQKVQSQLDYVGDEILVQATVDRMMQQKKVVGDARRIARADFKPKLTGSQRKLKERIVAAHAEGRFQPPDPTSFAGQAGGNQQVVNDVLDVCAAEGLLVKIADDLYLHGEAEADMRRLVQEKLTGGTGLTVAEIRDLLGTTRKYAVPLCEYLDRVGLTRRDGDLRYAR